MQQVNVKKDKLSLSVMFGFLRLFQMFKYLASRIVTSVTKFCYHYLANFAVFQGLLFTKVFLNNI